VVDAYVFRLMAKLGNEIFTEIFSLQRRLIVLIDQTKSMELLLFMQIGETEATISNLEQLQNVNERLRNPYLRLSTLLLKIAEYQPIAPTATLSLLTKTIEETKSVVYAAEASIQEIREDWNLL
jgi:hypothetical protein